MIEVFVIALVCVDGAVRGNLPLSTTAHFVLAMVFLQLPNCYWEGTLHMDTDLLLP